MKRHVLIILAGGILCGAAIAANPAAKKKTVGELLKTANRGESVKFQAKKQTSLPTFSNEAVPATKKSSVDLSQVKPPKTSSFYSQGTDDRAKLEKITDQQIRELFKLTQKFKNSPQRGELWLRLAELYVEKAGVIEYRKQTEYDEKLKAFQTGQTKVRPQLNNADYSEFNKRAIQLYEWFVRDFPKDPKMDQALFFLGYNHYELGDQKKGTAYYDRLTKEYPKSSFVVEANFALGEFYFDTEKWSIAKTYYGRVLSYPRHRLYGFSLYKTAWCFFRTGHSADALKYMENLIRIGKQAVVDSSAGGRSISKNRLESEGLRDIVLFYADVGLPEKAPMYFRELAGDQASSYLEKLAYFYADRGSIEGARVIFEYLISQNPTSPKAFEYKYQIVQHYSTAKKSREFREGLYSWVKDYGTSGAWYQANKANQELVDNSFKLRETTLRTHVLQMHQAAQNSRASFSQTMAMQGYNLYLREFPTAPMIADMHFYYGELLYDLNKFNDAGLQYRWVVENAPQSKFAVKAAENVVLALERDVPKDQDIAQRVGKNLEPVQFDPRVDRFVIAANWYLGKFPDIEKAPEIKFRVGRLYYQHNQFDQAVPYFREIVQKNSTTSYAEYSANLLLDIYNLKKDYSGLEKVGGELLAVPSIANSKAGQDIRGVLEKATFKRAQDLEVSRDYAGSAQYFETFAKQNPHSSLATTAIFNAAINFERAGMVSSAIIAHNLVLNSKDKSAANFKPKSRRVIGKLYQDSGMLEEAAIAYRSAAIELGNDPLAPNLYFNAGIINESLGKNSEALKDYQSSYAKNKKSDRVDIIFQMATMLRKQGSLSHAVDKYKEYISGGGADPAKTVESAYWIYDISATLNRKKDTDEWQKKTLNIQRRFAPGKKGIGAEYAAKIRLKETLVTFAEMKAIAIPANPKRQQQAAQNKIALMTKLNQSLAEVLKYDSPEEIVGALSILGQGNLHMAEALVNAPIPLDLNQEETKQYRAGVQKLAEPFYAKAKESLKATLDRASELDTYNSYTSTARELLAKLDPKLAYDGEEISTEVRQPSWMGL
jgi:TolA-binding protein